MCKDAALRAVTAALMLFKPDDQKCSGDEAELELCGGDDLLAS